MKALEYLKKEREIKKHCADVAWGYYDKDIDKAIKELEEYESDMDSYLDYTTGSRCTKSFNSSLGSIKNAYDRELEKIVKENIEHELSEHKSSKNISTNSKSSLLNKLFSFLIFTSIPGSLNLEDIEGLGKVFTLSCGTRILKTLENTHIILPQTSNL